MENRCVCCGEQIPEGTQICPNCSKKGVYVHKETKAERFERIMNDWVFPILLVVAIIIIVIIVQ